MYRERIVRRVRTRRFRWQMSGQRAAIGAGTFRRTPLRPPRPPCHRWPRWQQWPARYLRAREAAGPNRGVPSGARIARVAIGAAGAVVDRFAHIANARNERDVDTIFEVLKLRGVGALLIIGERHHSTYR